MSHRTRAAGIWVAVIVLALVAFVGVGIFLAMRDRLSRAPVAQLPTTAPASTLPATQPATAPAPRPVDYMDVVRLHNPNLPATQPLIVPLQLPEAARLVIPDPVHLDPLGELWITRADAPSTLNVLKTAHERSTHVLRELVVFVHRWPDDSGVWQPHLVCKRTDGRYEIVTQRARTELPAAHDYRWSDAFSWNDVIVVPTERGISVIRPNRLPMELHHEFIAADQYDPARHSRVQALLDWRGLLAWMPWEPGKLGSRGAARFVGEQWTALDAAAGWPQKLLHLVPLLDGGVVQLVLGDDNSIDLRLAPLDPTQVDEKRIAELVAQLSDPVALKRVAAFNELTRWGPGVWPILERLQPDQPPEAQIRMQQLLDAKTEPTLGGLRVMPGPVQVLARSMYGTVMLYLDAGVSMMREGAEEPFVMNPAWISIQPGRSIEIASSALATELQVTGRKLVNVRGEWIVIDDVEGPRWWLSNHLTAPLLKGNELEYRHVVGTDRRGRWLFRKNEQDLSPTLILDPTLPDPTPRLPVWVYTMEGLQVGWTPDNWPAIKRGGAWALVNSDWKPLDEKKEKERFLNINDPLPEDPRPTTLPATTQASEKHILLERDGAMFFDGRQALRMVRPDGREIVWPLPAEATGADGYEVRLFRAGDNRLFLFNAPGRVIRLRQTENEDAPFKLEATFTRRIPNADRPDRIWLDPAGRIVIATDGSALAVCYPGGRIPPEMAKKMTAADLADAEADE